MALCQNTLHENRARIVRELSPEPLPCWCAAHAIEQVVINLLRRNEVQALSDPGQLADDAHGGAHGVSYEEVFDKAHNETLNEAHDDALGKAHDKAHDKARGQSSDESPGEATNEATGGPAGGPSGKVPQTRLRLSARWSPFASRPQPPVTV